MNALSLSSNTENSDNEAAADNADDPSSPPAQPRVIQVPTFCVDENGTERAMTRRMDNKNLPGNILGDESTVGLAGDPKWETAEWEVNRYGKDSFDTYRRRMYNPPCIPGQSFHNIEETPVTRNGDCSETCRDCGAFRAWNFYELCIEPELQKDFVFQKCKATGVITKITQPWYDFSDWEQLVRDRSSKGETGDQGESVKTDESRN